MAAGTPLPDDDRPGDDLRRRGRALAADAGRRPDFPTDAVEGARAAASALGVPTADADIRAAVAAVEEHAPVDPEPPLDAHRRQAAYAKRVVSRLVRFSNHHLAAQISGLGWSVAWLGRVTAERIEALEAEVTDLRARLARLEGDSDDGPRP